MSDFYPCKLCGAFPEVEEGNVSVFHPEGDCRMVEYLHGSDQGMYGWDWQTLMEPKVTGDHDEG